jgi:predicted aspartyl protease
MTVCGVVDSGATRLVLPQAVAWELGLPVKKEKIRVRYADGRRGLRSEVEQVSVSLQGRDGVFKALVEPKRDSALIGAIVLEDLDFLVDCTNLRLVPRDPDYVTSEIEWAGLEIVVSWNHRHPACSPCKYATPIEVRQGLMQARPAPIAAARTWSDTGFSRHRFFLSAAIPRVNRRR